LNNVAIETTLKRTHQSSCHWWTFINIWAQKWKGTAAILNNIPIVSSAIPIETKQATQPMIDRWCHNIKTTQSVNQATQIK
jgi:hypothetical protein